MALYGNRNKKVETSSCLRRHLRRGKHGKGGKRKNRRRRGVKVLGSGCAKCNHLKRQQKQIWNSLEWIPRLISELIFHRLRHTVL